MGGKNEIAFAENYCWAWPWRWSPPWPACASARAQDYPSQDIRMIVGFPAGSGADVFVRYFAEKLRPHCRTHRRSSRTRPGAASNIATEFVAKLQARRTHALPVRRHHGGGQHAPLQEPAGGCRQGAARGGNHQQPRLHARGRCQQPLQVRGRADGSHEAEGQPPPTTPWRPTPAASWAPSTRTRLALPPPRCSTAARRIP